MNDEKKLQQIDKSCWRKNGVWGAELPRCEKLKYFIHCRNCDVFERAAVESFSVALKEIEDSSILDVNIKQQSYLPFRLSTYCFSVPTNSVITISDQVSLHSIPFNNNGVIRGLVAINHEVYPLLNLPDLLSLKSDENIVKLRGLRKLYKRVLVVDLGEQCVAFYVDDVYPIHHFSENSIEESKSTTGLFKLTRGFLKKRDAWCDNCFLLSLSGLSIELEKGTNDSRS